jgi:DNA-binding XRE family transcriptional regulator
MGHATNTNSQDFLKLPLSQLEKRRLELGMPRGVVAKLASVSEPTVTRIFTNKAAPELRVIRAIAIVLKVEVRVAEEITVVSRMDADDYRKQRAKIKAARLVQNIQGSMGLEAQAVDVRTVAKMVERTVHELLAGSKRKLWED